MIDWLIDYLLTATKSLLMVSSYIPKTANLQLHQSMKQAELSHKIKNINQPPRKH